MAVFIDEDSVRQCFPYFGSRVDQEVDKINNAAKNKEAEQRKTASESDGRRTC
jgi:hypothetical protein